MDVKPRDAEAELQAMDPIRGHSSAFLLRQPYVQPRTEPESIPSVFVREVGE